MPRILSASATSERWHRLGAHDGHASLVAHLNEGLECNCKLLRLHVVRVPAKALVPPTGIERSPAGVPQAMHISRCAAEALLASAVLLNCGLCCERGMVRMSMRRSTPQVCSNLTKRSIGKVE